MKPPKHSNNLYPDPERTEDADTWRGACSAHTSEEEETSKLSTKAQILRFCLGLFILLPLNIAIVRAIIHGIATPSGQVESVLFWLRTPIWYSIMGALTFASLAIMSVGKKYSLYLYVVGHELTHAISILLCGGSVKGMKIDIINGSYVLTSKTNIFIALSPYFIPFWMFIWMLTTWGLNQISPFPTYLKWFYFGFGFWWVYHIYWTVCSIIQERQPDLFDNGLFFSLMIIALLNFILLIGILLLFGLTSAETFAQNFIQYLLWAT